MPICFWKRELLLPDRSKFCPGAGVNLRQYAYQPCHRGRKVDSLPLSRPLDERKAIGELLTAFCFLHHKYGSRVLLDVVGFFEEAYREKLRQLTSLGIVIFHGFQKDPIPFYCNSDCVLLPSYHEGMSNVLLEAAAIGRPVISSDIPGCREAVLDKVSGYLCQPGNSQSLYQKMWLLCSWMKNIVY